MTVRTERTGEVTVVTVDAKTLDAGNVREFKNHIAPLIGEKVNMVLDLEAVDFVDSSGLGAILSCYRKLTSADGDLMLCAMSKEVRILFELVRMHRIVEIYNSRDEAIRAFKHASVS